MGPRGRFYCGLILISMSIWVCTFFCASCPLTDSSYFVSVTPISPFFPSNLLSFLSVLPLTSLLPYSCSPFFISFSLKSVVVLVSTLCILFLSFSPFLSSHFLCYSMPFSSLPLLFSLYISFYLPLLPLSPCHPSSLLLHLHFNLFYLNLCCLLSYSFLLFSLSPSCIEINKGKASNVFFVLFYD